MPAGNVGVVCHGMWSSVLAQERLEHFRAPPLQWNTFPAPCKPGTTQQAYPPHFLRGSLDLCPDGAACTLEVCQSQAATVRLFRLHGAKQGALLCPHPGSSDSSEGNESKVTPRQHSSSVEFWRLEAAVSWLRWQERRYHSICNIWDPNRQK